MASATQSEQEKAKKRGLEKTASFKKLGNLRVPKALAAIARVAALANTKSYTYDNAQRDKIIADLEKATGAVRSAFMAPDAKKSADYGL